MSETLDKPRARTIHMCVSVRGVLRWSDRKLKGMLRDNSGNLLDGREVRAALLDELSQGTEVLPIGPACEGWSPKTGCPGHEVPA